MNRKEKDSKMKAIFNQRKSEYRNFNKGLLILAFSVIVIFLSVKFLKDSKKAKCHDCNVILIAIETLRSDHLPCYGYVKNTAPNICKFAGNSVVFENHYTQEPYTLPGYASLFTSLYSNQHGMKYVIKDNLEGGITTFAQVLKNYGYTNYWSAALNDDNLPVGKGLDNGFDYYDEAVRFYPFVSWDRTLKNAGSKKSFMFLHTFKVHEPYIPTNKNSINLFTDDFVEGIPTNAEEMDAIFRSRVLENIDRLAKFIDPETKEKNPELFKNIGKNKDKIMKIILKDWENGTNTNKPLQSELLEIFRLSWQRNLSDDPRKIEFIKALYDAQIYETDEAFGKIITEIKDKGLLKNSIIIVYSPMGEQFNEHGTGFSHSKDLYQSSIKTPLIVYVPDNKPRRITTPVETIDIMPSVIDILGYKIPEQSEGLSFAGLMAGASDGNFIRRPLISMLGGGDRGETIIKDSRWKLILNYANGNTSKELYNINADPGEKSNIINLYPKIADDLERTLKQKKESMKIYATNPSEFPEWIDEQKRQRLKNEGYF